MSEALDSAFQFGKNFTRNAFKAGTTGVRNAYDGAKALGQAPPMENVAGATTPAATPVASPPVTPGTTPPSQPSPGPSIAPEPAGVRAPGTAVISRPNFTIPKGPFPEPPVTPGTAVGPAAYRPNFSMPPSGRTPGSPGFQFQGSNPGIADAVIPGQAAEAGAFVGPAEPVLGARYANTMTRASNMINPQGAPGGGVLSRAGMGLLKAGGAAGVALGGVQGAIGGNEDTKTLLEANGSGDAANTALTAGGVAAERVGRFAGAIAGGGLGASVGSVVPVVGTALGGVVGGAAGYFAPDAVKWATDKLGITDPTTKLPSETAADLRAQPAAGVRTTPAANTALESPVAPVAAPAAPGPASNEEIGAKQFALSDTFARGGLPSDGRGTVVDRGSNGLRQLVDNPQALAGFNALQTARNNGIRADVRNGQVVLSNDPTVQGGAAPTSGIDLNAANAIQARANAIRASTATGNDPNALFPNDGGGSGGAVDMSLGGAIGRRHQREMFQQRLQAQDLGLRRDSLNQTIAHNNATTEISRDQLRREGLRDQNTVLHQQAELERNLRKDQLEYGFKGAEYQLAKTASERATQEADMNARQKGADDYGAQIASRLADPATGKADPTVVAQHVDGAKAFLAQRAQVLQAQVQADPKNTQAKAEYDAITKRGLGGVSEQLRDRLYAGGLFDQLAAKVGTGPLTPWGGTDIASRVPTAKIVKQGGDYVALDQFGRPTGRKVPARYVDGVAGNSFMPDKSNQLYDALKN